MRDWLEKVGTLRRGGQRFATATVVGRRAPVSAHLGDRAIVHADGRMEGFIGGACSREIVRKQALDAIRTGRARLVSITPDASQAGASNPEHVVVAMTCVSEGAVDVYVEPDVRPRTVVVVGATPVADALARTAATLDYNVVRVVDAHDVRDLESQASALGYRIQPLDSLDTVVEDGGAGTAAVVASQGHYDEQALEAILAEIVQSRPDQTLDAPAERVGGVERAATASHPETAVDPVCQMDVEIAPARHTAEVGGTRYYFCCAHCQSAFVKDPASYLTPAHD